VSEGRTAFILASIRCIIRAGLCTILVPLVACGTSTTGSGRVVTKSFPISSLSRIVISNAFDVDLSFGASDKVTLRVDDNLVDQLDVGVSDETLRIALAPRTSAENATLHADVIARTPSSIEVSGAANLHFSDGSRMEVLDLALSGSSRADGAVDASDVDIHLSGASHATLIGSVSNLVVEGDGASVLDAGGLQVQDLRIDLSGATQAHVSVVNTISAVLSGASSLRYEGAPKLLQQEVTGGSTIIQDP
jgi:hypothetical protein